ncbi:MAG TPA: hypothetical protein VK919_03065 [Solirubrobacterales bacterium]|nr:hypothetical protein [Solirubrobacterales bacterium]
MDARPDAPPRPDADPDRTEVDRVGEPVRGLELAPCPPHPGRVPDVVERDDGPLVSAGLIASKLRSVASRSWWPSIHAMSRPASKRATAEERTSSNRPTMTSARSLTLAAVARAISARSALASILTTRSAPAAAR